MKSVIADRMKSDIAKKLNTDTRVTFPFTVNDAFDSGNDAPHSELNLDTE